VAAVQHLPHLGVADESILLVEWRAEEGASVRAGEVVACVETLKAAFEVESEHDGVLLRRLAQAGERLVPLAPLCVIGVAGEALPEARPRAVQAANAPVLPSVPPPRVPPGPRADAPVAPAARTRARELGLDLAGIAGTGPDGLVRLADVERAAASCVERSAEDGRLEPEFLAYLRQEGEAFARLSSDFRLALYRRHGARIGEGAHLGEGTLILAERLVLGPRAHLGAGGRFEAVELVAGELLHFGPRARVRCRRLVIGDNAFFAEDVEIGGGGALDPEAELVVGSHGFVGEHVHLNPCRPLVIGDEVVVSRGVAVMTHSFGASVLAGYPNRFAGVELGDRCQLGIHAVLFPGVSVGAGAIVLSGSSLVTSVPPGRLFGGVPAVDLKAAARPLEPAEFLERARELVREFARQLALRGRAVETVEEAAELRVRVRHEGALHLLRLAEAGFTAAEVTCVEELRVSARYPRAEWEALGAELVGLDLAAPAIRGRPGPLAEAFREFLRKRGVRLHPRSWTYSGGWL
jgi:acetyltransferase-like isoleucine patch superfamily enzyme